MASRQRKETSDDSSTITNANDENFGNEMSTIVCMINIEDKAHVDTYKA